MLPHGDGPIPAEVMIVGEAWDADEERLHTPFVGASGSELNRMLQEVGLMRSQCYVTNLVNQRPPGNDLSAWIPKAKKDITSVHVPLRDRSVLPIVREGYEQLLDEIDLVKPNVIVPVRNFAMWALTGRFGILKWRGSQLRQDPYDYRTYKIPDATDASIALQESMKETILRPKVIPTIHPASVLREWSQRALVVEDLRRVKRHMHSREYSPPEWKFTIRPSFERVKKTLEHLDYMLSVVDELWLDLDIETRAGHIACIGLSWSKTDAICIPLMCSERIAGYWNEDEEAYIVHQLSSLLQAQRVRVRWQNGLFDAQYIHRSWHFIPRGAQDTMIAQHSCFSALPKGLSFLASMYAEHYVYWKEEGKTWDKNTGEDQLWTYNCEDAVYTREVGEVLTETVAKLGLQDVDAVQQRLFWPVLKAMLRGVRVLPAVRDKLAFDIQEELSSRQSFLYTILGHPLNPASPKQMIDLFYEDMHVKPVLKRVTIGGHVEMRPTCDDDALNKIAARDPLLRPLTSAIADIRTLGKWLKDFVMMRLDADGRMRCSFNIAGDAGGKSAPYSYRLSSSKNPFGSGGNLQTIPSEKSKSAGKAAARGSMDFTLPNIRSMFGPDPGYTFFDLDLDRADLQVFAWEIGDELLKSALRMGADMHLLHVYILDNKEPPPLEELVETHPRYADHRGPRKHKREFSKVFCHATDYVGSARTVAEHTGRTVHEIDQARKTYLGAHPRIEPYWKEIEAQIQKRHYVENKFGYRWYIFDRLDRLLPEAVAWIPQSTVGCTINRIWLNFYDTLPEVETLLQVHDSLAGQFNTSRRTDLLPKMQEAARVVIPYDDPLIIPCGIKTSEESWGDCH